MASVLRASLIGFPAAASALLFLVLSVFDPEWLLFAVPFLCLAVFPLFRPLRICDQALVVPRFIFKEFRQPLSEVTVVEVGTFAWSGLSGYKGWALVIHTRDLRRLVHHSQYCGERRLREWAAIIEGSSEFEGEIRHSNCSQWWETRHNFPVV